MDSKPTYFKYFLFFIFCLFSPDIFAGVFDVVVTDKSKELLGIFLGGKVGPIVLGGGANPLLPKMFERLNFIVVTFGVLTLSYTVVVATINTAREGEALGKKYSIWVVLRGFIGMLAMLPLPATGYSIIQITVIWVVVGGIGAANTVYNVVLDQVAAGVPAIGEVELQGNVQKGVDELTENILKMSACKNVLNQMSLDFIKNHGPIAISFPTIDRSLITPQNSHRAPAEHIDPNTGKIVYKRNDIIRYTPSAIITVGPRNNRNLNLAACGHIRVQVDVGKLDDPNFSEATALNHLQTKVNAVRAVFDTVALTAEILSNPLPSTLRKIPDNHGHLIDAPPPEGLPGTFQTARKSYIAENIHLVVTPKTKNPQMSTLKSLGWIEAANVFPLLRQGNKINNQNATRLPLTDDIPSYNQQFDHDPNLPAGPGFREPLNTALHNIPNKTDLNKVLKRVEDFAQQDKDTSLSLPFLGTSDPSIRNGILGDAFTRAVQGIQTTIMEFFTTEFTGKSKNPLHSIALAGSNIMAASEATLLGLIGTGFVTMLSESSGALTNLPWAQQILLFTVIPGLAGMLILVWTLGATLAIYVPMIPYLIFLFTAIGWMVSVILMLMLANFIALWFTHPAGGDELGKIAPALGSVFQVCLKPTLMIFGLVIAGSLLDAVLSMINFSFGNALSSALAYPTFFSIIPVLGLYTFIVVPAVHIVFSLIYVIPTELMTHLGLTSKDSTNPEKSMGESKGGLERGTQVGQEIQKGAAEQAMKQISSTARNTGRGAGELPIPRGGSGSGGSPQQ